MTLHFHIEYRTAFGEEISLCIVENDEVKTHRMTTVNGAEWWCDLSQRKSGHSLTYYYKVTDGHGNGAEHVMRGETELLRGNWEDVELCWKLAVSAARRKGQYSLWLAADFLKARLLFLQGALGEAEALLAQQDALLRRERRYDLLNTVELCRAWLAAILGREAEDAPRWLRDETEPSPLPRPAAAMVELPDRAY